MIDLEKYTFVIRKTDEDEEEPFVARVIEFPYLAAYGKTPAEAYEGAVDTIKSFEEEKLSLPNPLPNINEFSGRISLRIPKSLHRKLANSAEVEGVSINQYLGNLLSWASENYYSSLQRAQIPYAMLGIPIFPRLSSTPSGTSKDITLLNLSPSYMLMQNKPDRLSIISNAPAILPKSSEQQLDNLEKRNLVNA